MNPMFNNYGARVSIRREPGLVLLYGIVTCHIYYLYWLHAVSEEILAFDMEPDTAPGIELLLSLVTCGLYTIYWDYKIGQKIARMQQKVGIMPVDNSILYLVLNFIAVTKLVPSMIIQGHLNDIWFRAEQNYARTGSYYAS